MGENEREALKTTVIDESNFDQYFFDTRKNRPKPGQILACYEADAELVDGNLKRDIVHLLMTNRRAGEVTVRLLAKLAGATPESAVKVIKQMTTDLLRGVSSDDVLDKPYPFHCQYFFYTWKECLPERDPHWWSTALIDVLRPSDEAIDALFAEVNEN